MAVTRSMADVDIRLRQVTVVTVAFFATLLVVFLSWIAYSVIAGQVNWTAAAKVFLRKVEYEALTKVVLNPWFYGAVVVILALEVWIPADTRQPLFSLGMRVDAVYLGMFVLSQATLRPAYAAFLTVVTEAAIGDLVRPLHIDWHPIAAILVGYLAVDFLGWFRHLVVHKVRPLWYFHAVHHSQRQMNLLADTRLFPAGGFFGLTITFVPAYVLTGSLEVVLGYLFFHDVLDRLNHSNVRTNLGWLRYVLVTPQSHRLHHSRLPAHYDTNFGVSLCIWDRLFGTQCDDTVYPPTGIPDPEFPLALEDGRFPVLRLVGAQLLYPFRKIAADLAIRAPQPVEAPPRPAVQPIDQDRAAA